MILVFLDDKFLLTKTITYLESASLSYTTDLNVEYEYILIGEANNKVMKLLDEIDLKTKKIIFLSYLEEENILKNKINDKLNKILNKSYKIIVSLPSIKNILKKKIKNDIVVIERELPIISISKNNSEIYNKYKISKRKKKILLLDFDYNNIEIIHELATKYNKINFIYVGFKSDYLIKEKQLNLLYNMPKNVTLVKYFDFNILSDLVKVSSLVINFEIIKFNIEYLYMILLFKKQLLTKESIMYEDYLINSKNAYIFKDNKDLLIRLNKILTDRVANLTDNGYLLIKDNNFNEIAKKYSFYIK